METVNTLELNWGGGGATPQCFQTRISKKTWYEF